MKLIDAKKDHYRKLAHEQGYRSRAAYKLKEINKDIKFSSDFIVGYPGETESDFEDTITLIKKIGFVNSYSFIFSPRPGTPAANKKLNDSHFIHLIKNTESP